jgi:hypothetical protein
MALYSSCYMLQEQMLMSLFHKIEFFKCVSFFLVPPGKVLLLNSLSVHMLIFYMYTPKV